MSRGDTCFICKCDVGAKGGILSAKCFGGCAQRNYCHDCIVEWRNINHNSCPICKKFLYLTVWTGTGMFVAFECIILSLAVVIYASNLIKLGNDCDRVPGSMILPIWMLWMMIQILQLLNFLFFENYGIFEKWLSPIVKWYDNVNSRIYTVVTSIYHSLLSAIKPIYHSLSPVIKPVILYAILGLLCIWVAFISTTFAGSNVGTPCY